MKLLERGAIGLASLALSIGAIAALSGFFAGRDTAQVSGSANATGPGLSFPDLGHARLLPGQPGPHYDSRPPTSGAHVPEPLTRDGVRLSDNQLLQALELGDVVIEYGGGTPPPGLQPLARALAPPFSPALAAAGQAVVLAHRPGTNGVLGLAWAHAVSVGAPGDPRLRAFIQFWLGRGAPGR
ncbi:MAG: DUF3105 domain-containing protein [Actinomycetota bacterium]|nr:DUF3105 domain-containing protein [Actinomycetota bacterium]